MKMLMYAGLETKTAPITLRQQLKIPLEKNLLFGEVKTAVAKHRTNDIVYEVVYVDIIDPKIKRACPRK